MNRLICRLVSCVIAATAMACLCLPANASPCTDTRDQITDLELAFVKTLDRLSWATDALENIRADMVKRDSETGAALAAAIELYSNPNYDRHLQGAMIADPEIFLNALMNVDELNGLVDGYREMLGIVNGYTNNLQIQYTGLMALYEVESLACDMEGDGGPQAGNGSTGTGSTGNSSGNTTPIADASTRGTVTNCEDLVMSYVGTKLAGDSSANIQAELTHCVMPQDNTDQRFQICSCRDYGGKGCPAIGLSSYSCLSSFSVEYVASEVARLEKDYEGACAANPTRWDGMYCKPHHILIMPHKVGEEPPEPPNGG